MAASRSDQPPLPIGSSWHKSSFSGGACACVEVLVTDEMVFIRDTKDAQLSASGHARPTLRCDVAEWERFCQRVPGISAAAVDSGLLRLTPGADGGFVLSSRDSGTRLSFTQAEIDAFICGVLAGEFSVAPPGDRALASLH